MYNQQIIYAPINPNPLKKLTTYYFDVYFNKNKIINSTARHIINSTQGLKVILLI